MVWEVKVSYSPTEMGYGPYLIKEPKNLVDALEADGCTDHTLLCEIRDNTFIVQCIGMNCTQHLSRDVIIYWEKKKVW